jgi:hypothetical protein
MISNFSYISVRDKWTSEMFSYITKGRIVPPITPDPVFAFNYNVKDMPSKDYILKKFNLPSKYYLFSFFSSEYVSKAWLSDFEKLASKDGISCVALTFPQGILFQHPFKKEIKIPLSPIEWYSLIKYSQGYIGNNMHPIIVSLHNNVPCFSFDNYGIVKFRMFVNNRSSKIFDIMKKFNILNNRFAFAVPFKKKIRPELVIERLKLFDKNEIDNINQECYKSYIDTMNSILKIISM